MAEMRRSLRVQRALPSSGVLDGRGAEDLKAIFEIRRSRTAEALAEEFVELYEERFPKVVSVFETRIEYALTYLG